MRRTDTQSHRQAERKTKTERGTERNRDRERKKRDNVLTLLSIVVQKPLKKIKPMKCPGIGKAEVRY